MPGVIGAVMLKVSLFVPLPTWSAVSTNVPVSSGGGVCDICQRVDLQASVTPPFLCTLTVAEIVAPGNTTTLEEPFKVTERTRRASVNVVVALKLEV